jgi:hypothetical protein
MKFWVGVFTTLLVISPVTTVVTEYKTVVQEVEIEREWVDTPILDSLVDWDEVDRQTDCLWEFLQLNVGHNITLDAVLAAGYWTDILGGACEVMERMHE